MNTLARESKVPPIKSLTVQLAADPPDDIQERKEMFGKMLWLGSTRLTRKEMQSQGKKPPAA